MPSMQRLHKCTLEIFGGLSDTLHSRAVMQARRRPPGEGNGDRRAWTGRRSSRSVTAASFSSVNKHENKPVKLDENKTKATEHELNAQCAVPGSLPLSSCHRLSRGAAAAAAASGLGGDVAPRPAVLEKQPTKTKQAGEPLPPLR